MRENSLSNNSIYLPERPYSPTDDRFHLTRGDRDPNTLPTTPLGLRPKGNLKECKGVQELKLNIIPAQGKVLMEGPGTQKTDTTKP